MTTPAADTRPRKLSPSVRKALAAVKAGTCTETEFRRVVIAYAMDHDWFAHAEERGRGREGHWHTPVLGVAGFPDVVLVRGTRLVVAELKIPGGSLSEKQTMWINRLAAVPGIEAYVWWPRDWDRIRSTLRGDAA